VTDHGFSTMIGRSCEFWVHTGTASIVSMHVKDVCVFIDIISLSLRIFVTNLVDQNSITKIFFVNFHKDKHLGIVHTPKLSIIFTLHSSFSVHLVLQWTIIRR
jgi:hypothetical protein